MVYVAWVFTTQGWEMFTKWHGSERGGVVFEVEKIARCECRWEDVVSQVVGSGVVPGQWHWRAQQAMIDIRVMSGCDEKGWLGM